jgi:hypothetical protein
MKKNYFVGVREVHVRYYKAMAENEEDAKDLVADRCTLAVNDINQSEYSHELGRDTWSVEEASGEEAIEDGVSRHLGNRHRC